MSKAIPTIFRDCCAKEVTRYLMTEPFVQGEYVAATDGRICIRMPLAKCDWLDAIPKVEPDASTGRPPPIETLPWTGKRWNATVPIPDPGLAETEPCDSCNGAGYFVVARGKPSRLECDECDGTGKLPKTRPITLAPGWAIGDRYARLLRAHGVTEIVPSADPNTPHYFRLGDIEGLLMPLRT